MQQSTILRYHASLLKDTKRTEAFREAIMQIVREGDVVVDVGCGSGILSFFACQAGAQQVYAIDSKPIIHLAKELAQANGFGDRISFLQGKSTELEIPEQVDVIVSETLWNFGLGEGILPTIKDARERWLKPGGRIIPESFEMIVAPIEDTEFHNKISVMKDAYGLDMTRFLEKAYSSVYNHPAEREATLASGKSLMSFRLADTEPGKIEASAGFDIERDGTLHGLMGYFRSVLAEGITISNGPPNPMPNWAHAFFPMQEPILVQAGDRVEVTIQTFFDSDQIWLWSTRISRGDAVKAEFRQSTMKAQFNLLEAAKQRMKQMADD